MRKCREQWRGTAAHGLLKCPGPEYFPSCFQNWFYFSKFYIKADKYFPRFCMNSSLNYTFGFLTVVHQFYCFQGPSVLNLETLSHRSHVFQRFPLCLASLVMLRRNIRLEWFRRGNIDDIETVSVSFFLIRQNNQGTVHTFCTIYCTSVYFPWWNIYN